MPSTHMSFKVFHALPFLSLQLACGTSSFYGYQVKSDGACVITCTGDPSSKEGGTQKTLTLAFLAKLRNIQGTSKAKCKENFLDDLRKAIKRYKGQDLKEVRMHYW